MVYFVGAGPGDADLITVKGKRALQLADVVIFDRLINPFLLTNVKKDAKLIYCGKQPCKHTLRQEDIQKEILIHARKGKTVVRLKGGDPSVFGRVGEEAELLADHHINYEVIPGITAGIAATMYAGVPITHRKHSNSFAVVTGHGSKKDGTPNIDWANLANGVETIVFYMGVKHIRTITSQLIEHGRDEGTAGLVIQWGTYSRQRTIEGTLATLANQVEQAKVTNPAIIVIGNVVKLRANLAWFDQRPLTGRGIIVPSKSKANREWVQNLKDSGADVFEHEFLTEDPIVNNEALESLKHLSQEHELVLLSSKSVHQFLRAIGKHGIDLREIGASFAAINEEVKETLKMVGIQSRILRKKKTESMILIGGELEIESVRDQYRYSSFMKAFMLSKQKAADKDREAFNRLVDEHHVNILLLTNHSEVVHFLKFVELSGISKEQIMSNLKVICVGRVLASIVEAKKVFVDKCIETQDVSGIIAALEDGVLAKES